MTFEQQWIEYDYNPFILFNSSAKIVSLNSEAQFLLGFIDSQTLFGLATTNASVTFGFKTTFVELDFGRYRFFALTVGYQNDDEIGIKLYQMPSFKLGKVKAVGELSNIYALIDLSILTCSSNTTAFFEKDFDPTIPETIVEPNSFIKILNKSYACFYKNDSIVTKVFYRVGEHIKLEDKKYSLFSVEIGAKIADESRLDELKAMAINANFYIDIQKKITINIPIITNTKTDTFVSVHKIS